MLPLHATTEGGTLKKLFVGGFTARNDRNIRKKSTYLGYIWKPRIVGLELN